MRPADFPDFFHRAPPPGQSRVSRIRLDAAGRFWDGGELVRHEGVRDALATWIKKHPDDGRYILENGYDWLYLEVEDTPCFVTAVRGGPPEMDLVLLGNQVEPAPLTGWTLRPDGSLTVLVRGGALEARLLPSAQSELGPWLVEHEGGYALRIRDQLVPITGPDGRR
ncbi:MAG: hypothetical protein B6A08_05065 [Sorangiineae bacterium NIC37A_2]|nr:MAG: hypothetical protein B6A08_05065 [Sorangiineae bacterium NIC37A_2]